MLPTRAAHGCPVATGIALGTHDEPQLFLDVERGVDERLANDVHALAIAVQFGLGDKRDIIEVVLESQECLLVLNPTRLPVLEHVDPYVVRRLHQRPIRMPQVDGKVGLIRVAVLWISLTTDAAGEILCGDRGHSGAQALVGRTVVDGNGRAIVRCLPRIPFVQADVNVIARAVTRAALVAQQAADGHLIPVTHEHVGEVRNDDVDVVAQVDVHVVTEA